MKILSRFLGRFPSKSTAQNLDPRVTTYEEALRWFEHRKPDYDNLITVSATYVDPTGVFLDIGANIGYFSLLLTKKVNFAGSAFLFEPIPNLAAHCRKTFEEAAFSVQVVECALSDQDGEVEIFSSGDGNIGWNTLVAGKATPGMNKVLVPSRRFDSLGFAETPSFVKIDVEGAEHRVLRGMMESLRKWSPRPVILCEVGWGKTHPEWEAELRVFRELESLGYSFHELEGKNRLDISSLDGTTDILCLPNSVASR
jgi:FkbM family methyltransferase